MAANFYKDENNKLKKALNSTKTLMNMVIHDLRNPCSQIKFSILFAMNKLDSISKMQQRFQDQMETQYEAEGSLHQLTLSLASDN